MVYHARSMYAYGWWHLGKPPNQGSQLPGQKPLNLSGSRPAALGLAPVGGPVFVIRAAHNKDVSTFLKLARMVYFINLPPDERIISDKVAHSARCFAKAAGVKEDKPLTKSRKRTGGGMAAMETDSDLFVFALDDLENGGVVGTSQVRAHQGGPGNPNWSMQLTEKKFFSPALGQGTTHTVGKLYADESGPSEIGGLILQSSHRGHRLRPGRLLSFVRFHFIALYRHLFADRILAEMMAPVSAEGDNVFWDHFGRKFVPVKYAEADRFCQHNRGFIPELLPKDEIYITLFPLEVQNMVGVVSRETIPARRLLESLGFRYRNFIDPFDGGPHLDAPTDQVTLVKSTKPGTLGKAIASDRCDGYGIVSVLHKDGQFLAIESPYALSGSDLRIPAESMSLLKAAPGMASGATPLDRPEEPVAAGATASVVARKPGRKTRGKASQKKITKSARSSR